MTADGWMPAANFGSGKNSASALANAMRGFATRMRILFVEVKLFSGDDGRGGAVFGGGKIFLGFGKRQVAGLGGVGIGKAGERGVGVAEDFAGEEFCDFSSGKRH